MFTTLHWLGENVLVETFPQCTPYIYILIYIKGSKVLQTAVHINNYIAYINKLYIQIYCLNKLPCFFIHFRMRQADPTTKS